MPLSQALHDRLCKSTQTPILQADLDLEAMCSAPTTGIGILEVFIEHFKEDEDLKTWLIAFKDKYFSNPAVTHEKDLHSLRHNLLAVLGLHKTQTIAIDKHLETREFDCLPGTISRLGDIVESIDSSAEKEYINGHFSDAAKILTKQGRIYVNNEIHLPTGLKYLLCLLTAEEAARKDSDYPSSLDTLSSADVFRIREEFYTNLVPMLKNRMLEQLNALVDVYRAANNLATPELKEEANELLTLWDKAFNVAPFLTVVPKIKIDNTKIDYLIEDIKRRDPDASIILGLNPKKSIKEQLDMIIQYQKQEKWAEFYETVLLFEKAYGKDSCDDFQDLEDQLFSINYAALEQYISSTYPETSFTPYDTFIEMDHEALQQLDPLELTLNAHILHHTNQVSVEHLNLGSHALLQRSIHEILGTPPLALPAAPHTLSNLIMLGAPLEEIQEKAEGINGDENAWADDITQEQIARTVAGRPNGYLIYPLLSKVNKLYRSTEFQGKLLCFAITLGNKDLLIAILGNPSLQSAVFNVLHPEHGIPALASASAFDTPHIDTLVNGIRNNPRLAKKTELIFRKTFSYCDKEVPGSVPTQWSLLHLAVLKNNLKAVKALLPYTEDINTRENEHTVLGLASKLGYKTIVQELVKFPQIDHHKINLDARSPIMLAIQGGHPEVVAELIKLPYPDPTSCTRYYDFVLTLAIKKNNPAVVQALLESPHITPEIIQNRMPYVLPESNSDPKRGNFPVITLLLTSKLLLTPEVIIRMARGLEKKSPEAKKPERQALIDLILKLGVAEISVGNNALQLTQGTSSSSHGAFQGFMVSPSNELSTPEVQKPFSMRSPCASP